MGFSAEELKQIQNAPEEQQTVMRNFMDAAAEAGFDGDMIERGLRTITNLPQQQSGVGQGVQQGPSANAMVATTDGIEGLTQKSINTSEYENGKTSITPEEQDKAAGELANIVAQMIAQGKSDKDIALVADQFASSRLGGNTSISDRVVQDQYAVENSNMFASRDKDGQGQGQAQDSQFLANMFTGLAGLAAGSKAFSEDDNSQSIAFTGSRRSAEFDIANLGDLPDPGITDMRSKEQKQARSGGMALS